MHDKPLTDDDVIDAKTIASSHPSSTSGEGGFEPGFEPNFEDEQDPELDPEFLAMMNRGPGASREAVEQDVSDVSDVVEQVHDSRPNPEIAAEHRASRSRVTSGKPKNAFVKYIILGLSGSVLALGIVVGMNYALSGGRASDDLVDLVDVNQGEGRAEGASPVSAVDPTPAVEPAPVVEPSVPSPESIERLKTLLAEAQTGRQDALDQLGVAQGRETELNKSLAETNAKFAALNEQYDALKSGDYCKKEAESKALAVGAKPPVKTAAVSGKPVVDAKPSPKARPKPRPAVKPSVESVRFVKTAPVLQKTTISPVMGKTLSVISVVNDRVVFIDDLSGNTFVKGVGGIVDGKGSITSVTPNGCVMFNSGARIGRCN